MAFNAGFKTRKVPRDQLLNPPPRMKCVRGGSPAWLWAILVFSAITLALIAIDSYGRESDPEPFPEVASGELLLLEGIQYVAALHMGTSVETSITGIVARTTVTQRFRNHTDTWQEAVYVFPLPEDAAVDAMHMTIGDRIIRAEIREKEVARKIYTAAKSAGKQAALTEQSRPNLFSQSVANIPPFEAVEIVIRFVHQVRYDHGQFSLRLPLTLTPRYMEGEPAGGSANESGWSTLTGQAQHAFQLSPPMRLEGEQALTGNNRARIRIGLHAGLPLDTIHSPSHDISVVLKDDTHGIALMGEDSSMDRDFVLHWRPTAESLPTAAVFTERVGNHDFALMLLLPPLQGEATGSLAREMIFIVDTSGSMAGPSIEQAKRSLKEALGKLRPQDRFNIIAFSNNYRLLAPTSVPVDAWQINQAQGWLEGLRADGGTEMAAPLLAALESPEEEGLLKQVIFITDGAVGNEHALLSIIQHSLGSARLFTVGIGAAPNSYFMRKAAQFGRGTFTHIGSVTDTAAQMRLLFEKIDSPVARDIALDWHGSAGVEVYPSRLPALYNSEPLVIVARAESLIGEVQVRGTTNRQRWSQTLSLKRGGTASGIGTLWARARIDSLEDEKIAGRDAGEVREAVTRIALTHHLVSPYTSFVAVEEYIARLPGEPSASTPVPNTLPTGSQLRPVMLPKTASESTLALVAGAVLLLGAATLQACRRITTCA